MDHDAIPDAPVTDTVSTAAETSAETLAPGSVQHDGPSDSDAMTPDRVRSIAREVVDSALAEFQAAVPAAPVESTEETFQQPVRRPWTHRGGRS